MAVLNAKSVGSRYVCLPTSVMRICIRSRLTLQPNERLSNAFCACVVSVTSSPPDVLDAPRWICPVCIRRLNAASGSTVPVPVSVPSRHGPFHLPRSCTHHPYTLPSPNPSLPRNFLSLHTISNTPVGIPRLMNPTDIPYKSAFRISPVSMGIKITP